MHTKIPDLLRFPSRGSRPAPGALRRIFLVSLFLTAGFMARASALTASSGKPAAETSENQVSVQKDISYLNTPPENDYAAAQCKLDVYLPEASAEPAPLLVWFHGGALKGGSKTGDHSSILKKTAEPGDPAASAILEFVRSGSLPPDHPPSTNPPARRPENPSPAPRTLTVPCLPSCEIDSLDGAR